MAFIMRKENSTFNFNFLSEPGVSILHNNDYFGCSELENFACYVVADGLKFGDDTRQDSSARLAVEAVISAFNASPSMSKRALSAYLKAAHKALRENDGRERLRASITVVVTNYESLRYSWVGNCRFNLYRAGNLINESKDHSLSWEMMEDGLIHKDRIAIHEERHNLEVYLGCLKVFRPSVSKKIKLKKSDAFSIFTRGVWENTRTPDMFSAIESGENDPQKASKYLERLILDKAPADAVVDNYTVCFVFVDKVYDDPEAKKRRKRLIIIAIIIFIVIVIIVVAIILINNWRTRMRTDMNIAYIRGVEYIQSLNFVRASEELSTAYGLAVRLRDEWRRVDINNHVQLVEAIASAERVFEVRDYHGAEEKFGEALNRSRYANNLALLHIERRRAVVADHINVHQELGLGDDSADFGDFERAYEHYIEARRLASRLHYETGRQRALASISALEQMRERREQDLLAAAQNQVTSAQFIIDGDNAVRDGDLVSAMLLYQIAREMFEDSGNGAALRTVTERIERVYALESQNKQQFELAAEHLASGDEMMNRGEYVDARRFYLLARGIYANLNDDEGLRETQDRIEMLDFHVGRQGAAGGGSRISASPPIIVAQVPTRDEADD